MKPFLFLLLAITLLQCGKNESPDARDDPNGGGNGNGLVGGGCEGCELYDDGIPATLKATSTIVDNDEPGERITISGTIFKKDGVTPAANVIMYLYQTDATGLYSPEEGQLAGARHGNIRGWLKNGGGWEVCVHDD